MARGQTTQYGFRSGEWSPLMIGNSDLPRYQQCAESIENALVLLQGGITRRWGTRFIAAAKFANKKVRLMSWRFSNSQSYNLELGDLYVRFYTQSARIEVASVPVEVVSPWTEAQLADLEWVQYADTAFFVHPDKVPYRMIRISATQWKLQAAPFIVWPSAEIGLQPPTTATLSATSGAITITAGVAAFLAADVGRQVIADIGEATITGFTSTTIVNATATGFQALVYASGEWTITESPKTTLTFTTLNNRLNGGVTLTLGAAGWRATDVGSYVVCEDGMALITGFTSTTIVTGRVVEVFKAGTVGGGTPTVVESAAWTLEPKTWTATRGYPRAVSLHEQRLVFGGSYAEPVSIWASGVGRMLDLSRGVRDAAGFAQLLFAYDMSTIMHMVSAPTTLLGLTASAEMTLGTGNDAALTPTNIHPRTGSLNGASNVRPVLVNNDVIFAQDGGTKLRALAHQQTENALWAPDITWEAEHLFRVGVTDLCYSKRPYPTLYAVSANGDLLSCAIYRQVGVLEHDVLAWSHQRTKGTFISCATVSEGKEDQLWLAVQRTVGGSTVTYIELADYTLNTDAAVTGSGASSTTWTGFGHLNGLTCDVLGNGIERLDAIPVAGTITVEAAITSIEAGLSYDSYAKVPEIENPQYTIAGAKVRVHEVLIDVYDTIGLEVQGSDVRWYQFDVYTFGSQPESFTGKKGVPSPSNWDGGAIELRQKHPYKWTIRRVIRRYSANDG